MQRRQFLKSTSVALAATLSGCGGGEDGVAAQSNPSASPAPVPVPPPTPGPAAAPPPPPAGKFLDVPSQVNEQQMYDNVLGWTWSASDKTPTWGANPGSIGGVSLTDDTEGDDLWSHYQAYRRTGNPIHLQWAQRWRDWFVNNFYDQWAGGDGLEHAYGQGLILWGLDRNDSAALAAGERIAARIEGIMSGVGPGSHMSVYGSRWFARYLIIACYQAFANPIARWIALRDLLITRWIACPGWQDSTMNPNLVAGAGHYFGSSILHDQPGYGDYNAGFRINSSFSYALAVEGHWRAYRLTARPDIRDRLIKMARFISHYAIDPAHVNGMPGSWWGHANGGQHHPRSGSSSDPNIAPSPPDYCTSNVNTLVIGYKLSGDPALLAKAKEHFRKGTQYDDFGTGGAPKQPNNQVHHYIDTRDNSGGYFAFNKGELQYSYLLFENGGVPSIEA